MIKYFKEYSNLKFNRQVLIDIKNKNLNKIRKWEHSGEPEDYSEIYWSYNEGRSIFEELFPFECRGYQFVILPQNYRIGIHKDVKIGTRLGVLLEGTGGINFYSDRADEAYECTANYKYPTLLDASAFHDVINKDQERVTFFLTFTENYSPMLAKFDYLNNLSLYSR